MGYPLLLGQTLHPLLFLLVSSTDHVSPVTGAVPTVTLSKDGAAYAAAVGAVTETGNGWYKVAGNATDSGTLGVLLLHATAAGADPCDESYRVVGFNPDDAVHLGLSALPNVAAGLTSGLPLSTNNSGDVAVSTNLDKTGYALAGNVTVGAYAAGEDPATLLLTTPANKLLTNASGQVQHDLTQAVPSAPTQGSVGDALLAAEAQGVGKWSIVGTTLTLYRHDGVTVARVFTLDSATSPTTRT